MSASPASSGVFLAVASLAWREMSRFYRQRSRVIGAMATPVIFWLFLGAGMGSSFRANGAESGVPFLEYFFPGVVTLTVVFAAIYSAISTIEDRQHGFLQSVLVAPLPRYALVLGKLTGGMVLAVSQGAMLLLVAPLAGIPLNPFSFLAAVLWLFVMAFTLAGMGFYFAWKIDSIQGFHAVMNIVLMPMWMLSGAFFPAAGAQSWIRWIMYANPLTYALAGMRHVMYSSRPEWNQQLPSPWLCLTVTLGFGAVMTYLAASAVDRKLE